jgi:hypothetical protein
MCQIPLASAVDQLMIMHINQDDHHIMEVTSTGRTHSGSNQAPLLHPGTGDNPGIKDSCISVKVPNLFSNK